MKGSDLFETENLPPEKKNMTHRSLDRPGYREAPHCSLLIQLARQVPITTREHFR